MAGRSLARECRSFFDPAVCRRGEKYFADASIEILGAEPGFVRAVAFGSEDYELEVRQERSALHVGCTCRYFTDRGVPCKHLWALLRAIDEWLGGLGRRLPRHLELVPDPLDDFGVEDDDPLAEVGLEEDNEIEAEPSAGALPGGRPLPVPKARQEAASAVPWARRVGSGNGTSRSGPAWERQLGRLRSELAATPADTSVTRVRELSYLLDLDACQDTESLRVQATPVSRFRRPADGRWAGPSPDGLDDVRDREIVKLLDDGLYRARSFSSPLAACPQRFRVPAESRTTLVERLAETGRCRVRWTRDGTSEERPLKWEREAWRLVLRVEPTRSGRGKRYAVRGVLRRRKRELPLSELAAVTSGALVFLGERAAPLDDGGAFPWVRMLREQGELSVPAGKADELLRTLYDAPGEPEVELPDELAVQEVEPTPTPCLHVTRAEEAGSLMGRPRGPRRWPVTATLAFDYDGRRVDARDARRAVFEPKNRRLVRRASAAEDAAMATLRELGPQTLWEAEEGTPVGEDDHAMFAMSAEKLPEVVRTLTAAGWIVEADGERYRSPGSFHMEVSSGVDWFDLQAGVTYEDLTAPLPELLRALERGESTVRLDDGSLGLLPEQWLRRLRLLEVGEEQEDGYRFSNAQVGVLDSVLASEEDATWDATFDRARREIARFDGIRPTKGPPGFRGTLRSYQQEGLGWLKFLERLGFGGCLADDMGLGKTVQVLALLEWRRQTRQRKDSRRRGSKKRRRTSDEEASPRPSLVVAPASLVQNWSQEAARFAPKLEVLEHVGADRPKDADALDPYDLVLTTYATLRRDAELLTSVAFDYVVLDEAQAIKNARTGTAKAARALSARRRLALSGTPIENHLGELWSLFEFLNPGMLGSGHGTLLSSLTKTKHPDEATRQQLQQGLRPFILRRTKERVAEQLPAKQEQTLYCELPAKQRRYYEEIRKHYRRSLLEQVDRQGLNRSKIHVLEALLRLRQAACHPALVDSGRAREPGAKVEHIRTQLRQILDEGHKALVFSQFTELLQLVRKDLEHDHRTFEYLDGATRKRADKVQRFQDDPDCGVFLISLKAGGLGLNTTAADYVFLLDPWWNPAVETQAIDRTHRIGQDKRVMAYRMIAQDTVEEKVLQLQQSKRALADSIITEDNALVSNLQREDLELLLS